MKHLITLIIMISSFCILQAQVVPNGGFENWSAVELFKEPVHYNTNNPFTLVNSQVITSWLVQGKTPADSAIHIETTLAPNGNIEMGTMANVNFLTGRGGARYTGQPDSIFMRLRYKANPNDSVSIALLFFDNSGTPFAGSILKYTGKSNGWMNIAEPLQFPVSKQPVGYFLQMQSSSTSDSAKAESVLEVDYIRLNSQEQLNNWDFERWDVFEYTKPDSFEGNDILSALFGGASGVTRDPDAVQGDYSVRIETKLIQLGTQVINLGLLHTGEIVDWYHPINKAPVALNGTYKYMPATNSDFGAIGIIFVARPANMATRRDTVFLPLDAASDWTKFQIDLQPLNLPEPDSFSIIAYSSNPRQPAPGSVLYLDYLQFEQVTSVDAPKSSDSDFNVSLMPNPIRDQFSVRWDENKGSSAVQLEVFDQKGVLLQVIEDYANGTTVQVEEYPSGYYSVRITDKPNGFMKTLLMFKQ